MSLTRIRVWNAGDILTASDLNGEFNNIVNNVPAFGSTTLDIANHQLINALLELQAATQSSAHQGRIYYQTTEGLVHIDTGTVIARIPTIVKMEAGDLIVATNPTLVSGATTFGVLRKSTTVGRVLTTASDGLVWASATSLVPKGQCQLVVTNGTTLTLNPYNGNLLTINSVDQKIPDAGVTLSNTAVTMTSGQRYYVYASMFSNNITLNPSTTAYATQAGTGIRTMSGDVTQTLVGMIALANGLQFTNSATWMGVRSYFNPVSYKGVNSFTADRTFSAAAFAEINTEIRIIVLPFAFEKVDARFGGTGTTSVAVTYFAIGADGLVNSDATGTLSQAVVGFGDFASTLFVGLSEATHFVTIMGTANGDGGTGTLYGTTFPRSTLFCTVGL